MPDRYATDIWKSGGAEQLSRFRKGLGLSSPAFERDAEQGFTPSEDARRVQAFFKERTGQEIPLVPANSVQALDGDPIWGSGSAYADSAGGKAVVDPLAASSFVVAHEAAHLATPTELMRQRRSGQIEEGNPFSVPRDGGARARYVHELYAKPHLVEEARAQGVARGVAQKLSLPEAPSGWTPREDLANADLSYPYSYMQHGLGAYADREIGPPTSAERREMMSIERAVPDLLEREYRRGMDWVKGVN